MNRHGDICRLLISLVIVGLLNSSSRGEPPQPLAEPVRQLERWLDQSNQGDGWRRYLRLPELNEQIRRGQDADVALLSEILAQFSSEAPGLEMPRFAAVKNALADQVSRLGGDQQPNPSQTMATDLAASQANVAAAAKQLDAFLQAGSPENTAAWKQFIQWETLQRQIGADAADTEQLDKSLAQLLSGEPGLELPPFVDLREALSRHRRKVLFHTDDQMRSRYERELETIVEALNDADFRDRDFAQLSSKLELLDQLEFAPDLANATRQQFQLPNLVVSASSNIVAQSMTEPITRSAPIHETILGTRVHGTAHLNGHLTARLLPSEESVRIEVLLNGQSFANTVGRQGPVSIFTHGYTSVMARNAIEIDARGIRAEPTVAHCTTRNQLCGIRAHNRIGRKLVEKIAWKQARQQMRRAERIASRLATQRVEADMDETARQRVMTSNRDLRKRLRTPLSRRRLFPRSMRFWSTKDRLHFVATEGRQRQLAASTPPPSHPESEFVLQLHETALLNIAINAIGGLKLTDENAVVLIEKTTGNVPEEMVIKQDEDPWSITFDFQQPVRVTFDEDRISIVIRGRRFIRGNQVVRQATDIGATYDLSIADGRAKLQRVGDVEVTYPGKEPGRRLSLTELRNKTFLTNKFEGLFKPEIEGGGMELSEELRALEWLSELRLNSISAEDGWLSLGWK